MLGAPFHRFLRNPNYASTIWNRAMNRMDAKTSTYVKLEDPKSGKTVHLIGTLNSSTRMAHRTKELVNEVQPDLLYVQTNEKWWDIIKNFESINNQSDLNDYNALLSSAYLFKMDSTYRTLLFKLRLYPWLILANFFKRFPSDFHPFIPGLEMKWAIEAANKASAKVVFGGLEISDRTVLAFFNERRMSPIAFYFKYANALHNKLWQGEYQDQYRMLETHGGEAYAENVDRYTINWWTKLFEKYAPRQKRIVVDHRDEEIFHDIYYAKEKNIVALVNFWHLDGVEKHWRHTTGTEIKQKPINPIGDFDIDQYVEAEFINFALREIVCTLGRTEPASWQNYLTHYHKENFEPERTRHIQFNSWDDHDMDHKLHGLQDLITQEIPAEILAREWKNMPTPSPKAYDPSSGWEMSPDSAANHQKLAQAGSDAPRAKKDKGPENAPKKHDDGTRD